MVCIDRAPKSNDYFLSFRKLLHQLTCNTLETSILNHAILNIEILRLDAEHFFSILFITYNHITVRNQFFHYFAGALPIFPKFLTEIQVAGHSHTQFRRHLKSLKADIRSTLADGWSNTGPMKPVGTFQHAFPVNHSFFNLGNRRVSSVIYDLACSGHRSCLEKIYSHSLATTHTMSYTDSKTTKFTKAGISYIIFREPGDKVRIHTIICQRYGNIRLPATKSGFVHICLPKTEMPRCCKTEHNFPKSNNFSHLYYFLSLTDAKIVIILQFRARTRNFLLFLHI